MPESADIFELMSNEGANDYKTSRWEGSFAEFITGKLENDPYRYTRTAYQLAHDMLNYYGIEQIEDAGETLTKYKLFDDPFTNGRNAIFGLERTIMRLAKYIGAGAKEEGLERIFVLHGPVGTAKTSMLDLLARGLENYSATDEGEVLTFTWRLPRALKASGGGKLGFRPPEKPEELADPEVFAKVPCQLNDNPLVLIPRAQRKKYLEGLFAARYPENKPVIPKKALEGCLCHNCQSIYDVLMREYDGDWSKVVRNIQVERFHFSEVAGRGVAKVFPEGNVETGSSVIALDQNYRLASNLLSEVSFVKFHGKYVAANRGLMHYSDIYKKPVAHLQHLLSAIEEFQVDFGEISGKIDTLIVGTTNPHEYEAVRRNPLSKGIRSRARKIDVPYLLKYAEERKIYDRGLQRVSERRHITPHTTELAALWAILTRLEKPEIAEKGDFPEHIKSTLKKLSPPVKALLYNNEFHQTLMRADRENLPRAVRRAVRNEFLFEGIDGVPTRILQNLLADICETNGDSDITPFAVFSWLERLISAGGANYDFLAREKEGDYHDFAGFVGILRSMHLDMVTFEVENSVINVDEKAYDTKIKHYLDHVNAHNQKRKVYDKHTRTEGPPDESVMRYIEDGLGVTDGERDDFRFKVIARATTVANPGEFEPRNVYGDLYDALKRLLYDAAKARINWHKIKDTVESLRQKGDILDIAPDSETAAAVKVLFANMIEKYEYSFSSAKTMTLYYIEEKLRIA